MFTTSQLLPDTAIPDHDFAGYPTESICTEPSAAELCHDWSSMVHLGGI
jgi:hypothetical protein